MGGGKKRIPSLYPIILMMVFLLALLLVRAKVRADDGAGGEDAAITVTMAVEIPLVLDQMDALHPVFSGRGNVYAVSEVATSHRYVTVTLPENFEMETPAGTKDAPEGTSVVFEGSINARKGFENYKAKNGLEGKRTDDLLVGQLAVEIPLTADFVTYGVGDYSLSIPVTLTAGEAYGSYSETFDFTTWADLLSEGSVTVEDGSITKIAKQDCYLEIEPGISEIKGNVFRGTSYRELWIPSSVTSGNRALSGSGVESVVFEAGFETIPEGFCREAASLISAQIPEGVKKFDDYCFDGCVLLSDFSLPQTTENLGSAAFRNCQSLREITVSRDITFVGYSAFAPFYNAGLTKITLAEGVTRITDYLFAHGCGSLTELNLPESLEYIGQQAFLDAVNLKELTVRSNLTSGAYLSSFKNSGLETITFADGVTSIPNYLFTDGCYHLTELNIPASVNSIGAYAFENAKSLQEIEIKNDISVTSKWGYGSPFEGADLRRIEIDDGVTMIAKNMFSNACPNMETLDLPASVTKIGPCAFENCTSLKKFEVKTDLTLGDNTAAASPFKGGNLSEIVIDEGVTSIPKYLFSNGCGSVEELYFPDSVSFIGNLAFEKCTSLKKVEVNSNLTVGDLYTSTSPFSGGNITDITFADGITSIPKYLFADACEDLTELDIPATVTAIGPNAFRNCKSLRKVEIKNDIMVGDRYTSVSPFAGGGIAEIVIDEGVTTISKYLFCDACPNVEELVIPSSVRSIGNSAFGNCTSLHSVRIQSDLTNGDASTSSSPFHGGDIQEILLADGITSIPRYLFSGACSSMEELHIPSSVSFIGPCAFENCTSLKTLTIPSDISIGGISTQVSPFRGGGMEEIIIADGVTNLAAYLFKDACDHLKTLTLPGSLVSIGNSTFADCPVLTEIPLPSGLTTIGSNSFEGCACVKELHIRSDLSLTQYAIVSPFMESGIERIVVEDGVTRLPANLFSESCPELSEVVLPSSLRYIESGCFYDCPKLSRLVIRSNVGIENTSTTLSSFENCGLTTVTFTNGTTEIGRLRLSNKEGETLTVYLPDSIRQIDSRAFAEGADVSVMYAGDESQWEEVDKNGWIPTSITYGVQVLGARRNVVPNQRVSAENQAANIADGGKDSSETEMNEVETATEQAETEQTETEQAEPEQEAAEQEKAKQEDSEQGEVNQDVASHSETQRTLDQQEKNPSSGSEQASSECSDDSLGKDLTESDVPGTDDLEHSENEGLQNVSKSNDAALSDGQGVRNHAGGSDTEVDCADDAGWENDHESAEGSGQGISPRQEKSEDAAECTDREDDSKEADEGGTGSFHD